MPPDQPPFRFWLRRTGAGEPLFALRFEVFEGRGVLRVVRPGVLVDPPARVSGYETDLTLAQARASRFLHVSNYGRRRQTWFLTRISEELAERMDVDAWQELMPQSDRGALHLLLLSPEEMLAANLVAHAVHPATLMDGGLRDLRAPERQDPSERPTLTDHSELQEIRTLPPSNLVPLDLVQEPEAPVAIAEAPALTLGAPPTGLVRHLRRRLAGERLLRQELEARVNLLERRLQSQGGGAGQRGRS